MNTYNFPDVENALITAARDRHGNAGRAVEVTNADLAAATADNEAAQAARKSLIAKQARGEAVSPAQHADIEATLREKEAQLMRLAEVLKLQSSAVSRCQADLTRAYGLAHGPRLKHALRERVQAAKELQAADAARAAALARLEAAHDVATEALGAGFPTPINIPTLIYGGAVALRAAWWGDGSPTYLRMVWGNVADEALADLAAA